MALHSSCGPLTRLGRVTHRRHICSNDSFHLNAASSYAYQLCVWAANSDRFYTSLLNQPAEVRIITILLNFNPAILSDGTTNPANHGLGIRGQSWYASVCYSVLFLKCVFAVLRCWQKFTPCWEMPRVCPVLCPSSTTASGIGIAPQRAERTSIFGVPLLAVTTKMRSGAFAQLKVPVL